MQLWSCGLWRNKVTKGRQCRCRGTESGTSEGHSTEIPSGDIMNPDSDSSPRTELSRYQPQLSRLQDLAEEIGSTFHRFSGVLNAISDGHADECYPRKRIRLMLCGIKSAEESTLLGSVGSGAAELPMASSNINYTSNVLEMGPMDGPSSNDDSRIDLKSTSLGSPKPINTCKEEDYIASINLVQDYLDKIKNIVECGGSHDLLQVAVSAMERVTDMLTDMNASSSNSHSRL